MARRVRPILLAGLLALPAAPGAEARVLLGQQEALARAFPPPHAVERRTLYLSDEQAGRAAALAGVPVEVRVVPYYVGLLDGRPAAYAWFDTHLVRTLPETVMVLVGADGALRRIEILSFDEPEDYLPPERWLQQFPGRALDDELSLRRGIRALTGASLSSRAITDAARRVLALQRLFAASGGPPGGGAAAAGTRP